MQGVIILFFALVTWGASLSWGNCRSGNWEVPVYQPVVYIYSGYNCSGTVQKCGTYGSGCPSSYKNGNDYLTGIYEEPRGTCYSPATYWATGCTMQHSSYTYSYCYARVLCNTQAEADSVVCVNAGNVWQNGQCQGPVDSSACDSYRQECLSMGGRFVGNPVDNSVSSTGCLSFCDLCSSESQQRYRRAIAKVCCGKGQVPPENVTSCVNNELAGSPEMSFSSFDCDNRGGFDCGCEEVSSENSSTYQQICIDDDWPESSSGGTPGSSSSGEGGESSGGESPYPEGCDECPWLDSIPERIKKEIIIISRAEITLFFKINTTG